MVSPLQSKTMHGLNTTVLLQYYYSPHHQVWGLGVYPQNCSLFSVTYRSHFTSKLLPSAPEGMRVYPEERTNFPFQCRPFILGLPALMDRPRRSRTAPPTKMYPSRQNRRAEPKAEGMQARATAPAL